MSDLSDLLRLAQGAADAARAEILRHWQSSLQVEFKADNTPVTVADRNAEETIRAYLRGRDSGFGFVGEEFGREKGKKRCAAFFRQGFNTGIQDWRRK